MKIAVIGTGYVGLVAGCCFADSGNTVYCVDVDVEKNLLLVRGSVPGPNGNLLLIRPRKKIWAKK